MAIDSRPEILVIFGVFGTRVYDDYEPHDDVAALIPCRWCVGKGAAPGSAGCRTCKGTGRQWISL